MSAAQSVVHIGQTNASLSNATLPVVVVANTVFLCFLCLRSHPYFLQYAAMSSVCGCSEACRDIWVFPLCSFGNPKQWLSLSVSFTISSLFNFQAIRSSWSKLNVALFWLPRNAADLNTFRMTHRTSCVFSGFNQSQTAPPSKSAILLRSFRWVTKPVHRDEQCVWSILRWNKMVNND